LLGQISTTLTSFSRTLNDYSTFSRNEVDLAKKEKEQERLKSFRDDLSSFRTEFERLKKEREDAVAVNNRSELLGSAPMSPTRPPGVRERQSMQQIKDLEARLDQLASENRLLATAKINAEQALQELHLAQSRTEHATQEALELRDAELKPSPELEYRSHPKVTRPPSVRRRRSMQQPMDLEMRLEQPESENRLLATANTKAEQLQDLHFKQISKEREPQEALELRDAQLKPSPELEYRSHPKVTRPPSVRRRQSMQQLKDLEARLGQLEYENRLLATAKINAEEQLQDLQFKQIQKEHALQEALELRDAELKPSPELEYRSHPKVRSSSKCESQPSIYEPLDPGQIRLVDLLYGESKEPVAVQLSIIPFNEEVKYEALSYSVGKPEKTAILNLRHYDRKKQLLVTARLESILRYLRYPDKDRRLWVDAISINQEDLEERSREVRRLGKIFAKAQNVCIWLGDSADDSNLAMDFIPEVLDFGAFDKLIRDNSKKLHWLALAKLMAREWFTRRWVVQEMALARKATVHCGSRIISWPDMAAAAALFGTDWEEIVHRLPPLEAFMFGDVQTPGAVSLVKLSTVVMRD
jgi:hypothetical protein